MSVRAYRVTQPVVTVDSPSFNLWSGNALSEALMALPSTFDGINESGGGTIELEVNELREFLKTTTIKIEPEIRKALEADIEATQPSGLGDDYITYECF
jgi:hypothetical protein